MLPVVFFRIGKNRIRTIFKYFFKIKNTIFEINFLIKSKFPKVNLKTNVDCVTCQYMIPKILYSIDLLNKFTACDFFRIQKYELEPFSIIFQNKQKHHVWIKFFIQRTFFCRKGNIKSGVKLFDAGFPNYFYSKHFKVVLLPLSFL